MLADEAFGQIRVAGLEGLDDLDMLLDRVCGPLSLAERRVSDAANMHQEIAGDVPDDVALTQRNDLLVEAHIGFGIFVEMIGRLALEELGEALAQALQLFVRSVFAGEARRHALQSRPGLDHAHDLFLRLLDDEHAAACLEPDETLLFEDSQRFAYRRSAYPEIERKFSLVETNFVPLAIDVHIGNCFLERGICQSTQARGRGDRLYLECIRHHRFHRE